MKFFLLVTLLVAVAVSADALKARRMTRPVKVTAPKANGGRILDGNLASSGQFPFEASVIMDSNYLCGGSLISSSVILTAAHCISSMSSFDINLGTLSRSGGGPGSVSVSSRDSVLHPQYNPNTIENDIGLIRISPVSLTSTVNSINLPSGSDTYEGEVATVIGWGSSPDLMYVDLLVYSNTECAMVFGDVITDTTLCASGDTNTCNVDPGGPLILNGVQIGIMSVGAAAGCDLGYPVVFTRVASYLDWISSNSK